jgi:hypothetical protein
MGGGNNNFVESLWIAGSRDRAFDGIGTLSAITAAFGRAPKTL